MKSLNWANRITLARLLLILPFVACMMHINAGDRGDVLRYLSLAIFVSMAVSDAIDGWLARSRGQTTALGTFLDPMADKLLMTAAMLLLASDAAGVRGFRVPMTLVVAVIGKDLILALGFVVQYFITQQTRIVPVLAGKLCTAVQLSMVAATLIGPEAERIMPVWPWLVWTLWWAGGLTAVWAMV
ncbi:MAG TPA: CDP-alcohol phosphatidyltransferase family protein, partial [Sedimentisphaerales bacterium]|nr:CDP-alcohol phosphatidyltransferase family protein [Sedimentisphaerales bacterium]